MNSKLLAVARRNLACKLTKLHGAGFAVAMAFALIASAPAHAKPYLTTFDELSQFAVQLQDRDWLKENQRQFDEALTTDDLGLISSKIEVLTNRIRRASEQAVINSSNTLSRARLHTGANRLLTAKFEAARGRLVEQLIRQLLLVTEDRYFSPEEKAQVLKNVLALESQYFSAIVEKAFAKDVGFRDMMLKKRDLSRASDGTLITLGDGARSVAQINAELWVINEISETTIVEAERLVIGLRKPTDVDKALFADIKQSASELNSQAFVRRLINREKQKYETSCRAQLIIASQQSQ